MVIILKLHFLGFTILWPFQHKCPYHVFDFFQKIEILSFKVCEIVWNCFCVIPSLSQVHPKFQSKCTVHFTQCKVHYTKWWDLCQLAVCHEAGPVQVQPVLAAPDHVWEVRFQGRVMLFVCVSYHYSITTSLQVITGNYIHGFFLW